MSRNCPFPLSRRILKSFRGQLLETHKTDQNNALIILTTIQNIAILTCFAHHSLAYVSISCYCVHQTLLNPWGEKGVNFATYSATMFFCLFCLSLWDPNPR